MDDQRTGGVDAGEGVNARVDVEDRVYWAWGYLRSFIHHPSVGENKVNVLDPRKTQYTFS